MPAIGVTVFKGMRRAVSPLLLDSAEGVEAKNCDVRTGRVEPIKAPAVSTTAPDGSVKVAPVRGNWVFFGHDASVALATDYGTDPKFYYINRDADPDSTDSYPRQAKLSGYPTTTYRLGVPAPDSPLSITLNGTASGDAPLYTVSYVYTYVTEWGHEGAPSPPTGVIDVYDGQYITLTGLSLPSDYSEYRIIGYRIYRLAAGTTGAEYMLVPVLEAMTYYGQTLVVPSNLTSATDKLSTEPNLIPLTDLGEVLATEDFAHPPKGMTDIIATSTGFYVGARGTELYCSEPLYPYAWPVAYVQRTEFPIVALAYSGNVIFALTEGPPYFFTGTAPSAMSRRRLPYFDPCLSRDGVVSTVYGAIFPSYDGLILLSTTGERKVVTETHLTREQWGEYDLPNLCGAFYKGAYVGFFRGSTGGFMFDLESGTLVELDLPFGGSTIEAVTTDDKTGKLYVLTSDMNVYEFEAGTTHMNYTWRSKVFAIERGAAISSGLVRIDSTTTSGNLTITIEADGTTVKSRSVEIPPGRLTHDVFRLPASYASRWSFVLSGNVPVDRVVLATSMMEVGSFG